MLIFYFYSDIRINQKTYDIREKLRLRVHIFDNNLKTTEHKTLFKCAPNKRLHKGYAYILDQNRFCVNTLERLVWIRGLKAQIPNNVCLTTVVKNTFDACYK